MKRRFDRVVHTVLIVLLVAGPAGWLANVVKLMGSSADPLTGMVIARAIGVFVPPLGAVLGYI